MIFTQAIKNLLNQAMVARFGEAEQSPDYQVTSCKDKKFGDYQTNLAFLEARRRQADPRRLAADVIEALPANDLIESAQVAGPGFINMRLRDAALADAVTRALADPRCAVAPAASPQRIVVDYSSPNLAKDLHVGAMRSTVIGDAIARTLEFLGHDVIRQNHYGDWGTNFGILVAMIKQRNGADPDALRGAPLAEVEALYAEGSKLKAQSKEFAAAVAAEVGKLQSGDPVSTEIWRLLMEKTLQNCHALYRDFNVSLDETHDCPESHYRQDLPEIVRELSGKQLLVEDADAKCVYLDGFHNADGDPLPVIVQKAMRAIITQRQSWPVSGAGWSNSGPSRSSSSLIAARNCISA